MREVEIAQSQQVVQAQAAELAQVRHQLEEARTRIVAVQSTRSWRALQAWWRFKARFTPWLQRKQIHLTCDEPNLLTVASVCGSVLIRGWALAHSGIDKIEIHVDNQLVGLAEYGQSRPDVAADYPDFDPVEAEQSGFSFRWDSTQVQDGGHDLLLRAFSKGGQVQDLAGHVIVNNTALEQNGDQSVPVEDEAASPHERIILTCDEPIPGKDAVFGWVVIHGWALAESGIDKIEIYVDNQFVGVAKYGCYRPDVATARPGFDRAEQSGFRFRWDSTTVQDGEHQLLLRAISNNGYIQDLVREIVIDNTTPRPDNYKLWVELYESREILEAQQKANDLSYRPLISVIMPVHNTEARFLERAIESVRQQAYSNWELCICNANLTESRIQQILDTAGRQNPQLKIKHLANHFGLTTASNEALALASGEFIVLLDSVDELPPHALYYVVKLLNIHPDADLIYSDEDKIDADGHRYNPFFKPDWSPDLFLSYNYLNRLTAIRTNLVGAAGGFQPYYEGSQDYDLYLRVLEQTQQIYHIPKILYHRPAVTSCPTSNPDSQKTTYAAARRALTDHLEREHIQAKVLESNLPGRWRIKYTIQNQPTVAIILLTGGKVPLLEQCVHGLKEHTKYPYFEIVLVDNSKGEAVQQFLPTVNQMFDRVRYIDRRSEPFNFSNLNNEAVKTTEAPLILFLNDDIVPINSDWMEAMVEHAQRIEVGAVGAKLVYPDDTIQHAGVVMGIHPLAAHVFKGMPANEQDRAYYNMPDVDLPYVVRNCTAVTGACLMTRQNVFWEVDGFDEIYLPVGYQDYDLGLKMWERGYRIVYTPYAQLLHYEAKTKVSTAAYPYEVHYMQQRWGHVIANDPFYNPNLTRLREDFSIKPMK